MRRLCICVVMVPSLLFAAASPVQASKISSQKQEGRSGGARSHQAKSSGAKRSPVTKAQKYTYGRT